MDKSIKAAQVEHLVDKVKEKISVCVKYDAAQDLTDAQKAQARANIGAQELDLESVTITLPCVPE